MTDLTDAGLRERDQVELRLRQAAVEVAPVVWHSDGSVSLYKGKEQFFAMAGCVIALRDAACAERHSHVGAYQSEGLTGYVCGESLHDADDPFMQEIVRVVEKARAEQLAASVEIIEDLLRSMPLSGNGEDLCEWGARAAYASAIAAIRAQGAKMKSDRCPSCSSPSPRLHPAVQHEGEVRLCRDPWHEPIAKPSGTQGGER